MNWLAVPEASFWPHHDGRPADQPSRATGLQFGLSLKVTSYEVSFYFFEFLQNLVHRE